MTMSDRDLSKMPGMDTASTAMPDPAPTPPTPEEHEAMVRERIAGIEEKISKETAAIQSLRASIRGHKDALANWKRHLPRKRRAKK